MKKAVFWDVAMKDLFAEQLLASDGESSSVEIIQQNFLKEC
jgi:hypothetical protein